MKKIVSLIYGCLIGSTLLAQSTTEIHLGIGTGSYQELTVKDNMHPLMNAANNVAEEPKRTYAAMGPLRIGIKKHEGKHFLIGAEFNYTNILIENTYSKHASENVNFAQFTLMGSTQYKYIDKPNLTIYSGVDFGVSFARAKNKSTDIKTDDLAAAFQINALGVRYGTKTGIFAEAGYGYNGYLSAGIFQRID